MAAFALTLALFAYWGVVGWSAVSSLGARRNLVRDALLSPALGAACTVLPLLWLNQFGLPVRTFGPAFAALVLLAALLNIRRHSIPFPLRKLLPFVAVLLFAFAVTGYPMLRYGFNWVGYCNEDMANYVLQANNFLNHGYYDLPNEKMLLASRELSLNFWFFYTLGGVRPGSELTLAWVMSCTPWSGHQIFMPVIMAMHLMLISAAAAFIYRRRDYRLAALTASVWLAVSSQNTLGAMYQLIGQLYGLAILLAFCTLTMRPFHAQPRRTTVREALLVGVIAAALAVIYPEVIPFAVLPFILYHAILLVRRQESARGVLPATAGIVGAAALFLNVYLPNSLLFLTSQASTSLHATDVNRILFPYFLLPSGLAQFWGFLSVGADVSSRWIDAPIAAGALLLAACAVGAVWQAWRGQPVAVVCVVMLALGVRLFAGRMDFGLFKLAMFIQPFILGAAVLSWFGVVRAAARMTPNRRATVLKIGPIAVIAAFGLAAQIVYVERSTGRARVGVGLIEIPNASEHGLIDDLVALSRPPHPSRFVSDAFNVVLAKFQALYLNPVPVHYPSDDYFRRAASTDVWRRPVFWFANLVNGAIGKQAPEMALKAGLIHTPAKFDMKSAARPANFFTMDNFPDEPFTLVRSGFSQGIYNRLTLPPASLHEVSAVPSAEVKDHLIFVASSLGQTYYAPGSDRAAGRVAAYQLERDYFFPDGGMAALGRDLLFMLVNPSPRVRLMVEYTATLNADGDNIVPPATAVGRERVAFDVMGRGSSRIFSAPVEPQRIRGRAFLAVDMGVDGKAFPDRRRGLMRMYGTDVLVDPRRVIGFARNISAIPEEQYARLEPPSEVRAFPSSLANRNLEYSGIYEDGWVAERSFLRLRQPAGAKFVMRLMVPPIGGDPASSSVRALLDGREAFTGPLRVGENAIAVPGAEGSGTRRVEIVFDRARRLSEDDPRRAAALIRSIGFEEPAPAEIAGPPITIGNHWYPFEHFGGEWFRWVETNACFSIHSSRAAAGTLSLELAAGPGLDSKPFRLSLTGGAASRTVAARGVRESLQIPLTLKSGENGFCMSPEGGGRRVPSDSRILNFRVFRMGWKPEAAK